MKIADLTLVLHRLALAAWIVALVVGALAVRQPEDSPVAPTAESTDESTDDDTAPTSSEPLPAPLLIAGGDVDGRVGVFRPGDPAYDADDLFDGVGSNVPFPTDEASSTLIFARPSDPFSGPILGIELLDGGGFRPWGANLAPGQLDTLVDQLRRADGSWTISSASGLVQVADVVDSETSFGRYGWQFDFVLADDERVTLQAEAGTQEQPADEWRWISRLALGTGTTELTVTPTQVLDGNGIIVAAGAAASNEVVWSDGEFVYRLLSSTIEGDTQVGRDATEDVGRLRLVERAEWVDAIRASFEVSISERIVGFALLATPLTAIASAVWFLVRRSYGAAVIAAVVAAMLWWMGGLGAIELALAWIGLAIAWWRHRSSTTANPAASPTPP